MRKLLVIFCIALILTSTISPALAYDIDELYDSSNYHIKSTSYQLAKTFVHGPVAGHKMQPYQIQYSLIRDGSDWGNLYYKVTAQPEGSTEEIIAEGGAVTASSTSWQTKYINYEYTGAEGNKDVTVRFYVKWSGGSFANGFDIQNVYSRSYIVPADPYVNVDAVTADNAFSDSLEYELDGFGTYETTVYVDDVAISGSPFSTYNGVNIVYPDVSQGAHTWYVNVSTTYNNVTNYNETAPLNFTLDNIDPNVVTYEVSPDNSQIADGVPVDVNVQWNDANLDTVEYYLDVGSGFVLQSTTNSSELVDGWLNNTINTTGLTGNSVTSKQIATDEAGNTQTQLNSFLVILDEVNINVYDETTGDAILPTSIRMFTEYRSINADINATSKVGSIDYDDVESGQYMVTVAADDYYSRTAMIDVDITTLSELNVYLPSTNETVIYDTFTLTDNSGQYDPSECIIRLDKPIGNSTKSVYTTYFDFSGNTATYLIASDQYILYIITPDKTVSYGWLIPDVDGQISINLNELDFSTIEDWIQYSYTETDEAVSFDYATSKTIDSASFVISFDDTEVYNSTALTDTGSFNYVFNGNGTYQIAISVDATDGDEYIHNTYKEIGKGHELDPFPESYSLLLKSIIVMFVIVIGVLGCSAYRADLAALWVFIVYGFAVYQDWVIGNEYSVSVIGILALAAIVKFQRKQNRSVN